MKIHDFAIIGAGFGGLGMAAILNTEKRSDYVILERAARAGGAWRDNDYPGCACDVPSHLYWYSFDKPPDWTRHYAFQPEILRNIEAFVERQGLAPHIQYGSEVVQARWSDAESAWTLLSRSGANIRARHVVSATGQLSNPALPDIPGRDTFSGIAFHSAQWRHDIPLRGKRIAVIGNGASAIQFIPKIAQDAGELLVFQRSASYIVPRDDKPYDARERQTFQTDESTYLASREAIFETYESRYASLERGSGATRQASASARQHLETQVSDPVLRARLWPDYEIGCKRILISDDFYPAMSRPNVRLVTDPIERIEAHGIQTDDGVLHTVDVIVFATGFQSTRFLGDMEVFGREGISLKRDVWRKVPRAYLGVVEAGFPNFFMLYGPNTNLNHNSIIAMMEAQYHYIIALLNAAQQRNASVVEVCAEAVERYNDTLQHDLGHLVFGAGCHSWYKTPDGYVTNNWSGSVKSYQALTATPDLAHFMLA